MDRYLSPVPEDRLWNPQFYVQKEKCILKSVSSFSITSCLKRLSKKRLFHLLLKCHQWLHQETLERKWVLEQGAGVCWAPSRSSGLSLHPQHRLGWRERGRLHCQGWGCSGGSTRLSRAVSGSVGHSRALWGSARLCRAVPGSVGQEHQMSNTSPQGPSIAPLHHQGLDVIYKQELGTAQLCIYSHRTYPLCSACSIRCEDSPQWPKANEMG